MNIIICGAGKVGFSISKQLSAQGHSVTVIDQSSEDIKKIKFYRLKRTPLEILNRSFFFFFIGSFLFSLFLAYSESKLWFILYVISALSCVFYTPNRKALKELIAAWPNIEDLIKGRSMWRKGK